MQLECTEFLAADSRSLIISRQPAQRFLGIRTSHPLSPSRYVPEFRASAGIGHFTEGQDQSNIVLTRRLIIYSENSRTPIHALIIAPQRQNNLK